MNKTSPSPQTDFVVRAFILFGVLFGLLSVVLVGAVYAGTKSGEINHKIVEPLKNSYENFLKQMNAPAPAAHTIELKQVSTENSTVTPIATPTKTPVIYYVYPTSTPYPTIIPGQPGSKEWEEQFQKTWNDMSTKNSQMQQQVEDSQKKFCQEHADLCK